MHTSPIMQYSPAFALQAQTSSSRTSHGILHQPLYTPVLIPIVRVQINVHHHLSILQLPTHHPGFPFVVTPYDYLTKYCPAFAIQTQTTSSQTSQGILRLPLYTQVKNSFLGSRVIFTTIHHFCSLLPTSQGYVCRLRITID